MAGMITATKDTWTSLQKQLDMVASMLMGNLFLAVRPRLILKDDETASTDGRVWVKLPQRFMGVGLEDDRPEIFVGLLAHEVGHWLQPLKEIQQVEKETGLLHDFVNIILDINDEHVAGEIFPLFQRPLKAVRDLVSSVFTRKYRQSFRHTRDFVTATMTALLYCRYCVNTHVSFDVTPIGFQKNCLIPNRKAAYDVSRLQELIRKIDRVATIPPKELPRFLNDLAVAYPELCVPTLELPCGNPLGGPACGGEMLDAATEEISSQVLQQEAYGPCSVLEISSRGSVLPPADVLAMSRRLKNRWVAPARALSVIAPGRLDRMAALRNAPVPFIMKSTHPVGAKETGLRKVLLAADWSGSMAGQSWSATLAAARSISLAIQADGGDVRGLLFAENAWHTCEFDVSSLLFASALGAGLDLSTADGDGTSFSWLSEVWQRFPEHQVLILTDGAGSPPGFVPATCRKRTSVLLIGLDKYNNAEVREQILSIANTIANKVVEVPALTDLAGVWATLIPRRQIA